MDRLFFIVACYLAIWYSLTHSMIDVEWWGREANLCPGVQVSHPLKNSKLAKQLFLPMHELDRVLFRHSLWHMHESPSCVLDD